MNYRITEATPDDAAAIAALHADSWRAAYRGILPDAFLDHGVEENRRLLWDERFTAPPAERPIVIKAAGENALFGFACVMLPDAAQDALLDNLHVRPGSTGIGIGAALLHSARRRAAAVARRRVELWVFEANTRARRFYERQGATRLDTQLVEVLPHILVPEVRYVFDVPSL